MKFAQKMKVQTSSLTRVKKNIGMAVLLNNVRFEPDTPDNQSWSMADRACPVGDSNPKPLDLTEINRKFNH